MRSFAKSFGGVYFTLRMTTRRCYDQPSARERTRDGSPEVRGEDEHTRHGGTTGRQRTVGSFTADRVKRRVRLRTQQAQGLTLRQDGRPQGRDSSLALFTTAVSRQGRRPCVAVSVKTACSLASPASVYRFLSSTSARSSRLFIRKVSSTGILSRHLIRCPLAD